MDKNTDETQQRGPLDPALLKLLAQSIDQTSVSVLITDAKGNICYVNSAFTRRTGYEGKEVFGKNPRILKSGLTPEAVYKKMWAVLLSGKPWSGDLCNKNKAGKFYWESITISPVRNEEGETIFFAAFWEDVTARKFDEGVLKSHLKNLEHENITDALTGAYNRRYVLRELQKEVHRSVRYKRRLAGMMIDIDQFKSVNDHYGHLAGDHVISEMAKVIQENLRNCDILGRYGGDEFLVILPETPSEYAGIIAERVRKSVAQREFLVGGKSFFMTVSIGLLSLENLKQADEIVFIGKIDQALLRAKKAGKNQIVSET